MEEGKRRASGVVSARRPTSSWLRHFEVDRTSVRRGSSISRHLALSAASPAGGTGLDRWALGGKGGTEKAAVLQPDRARQARASLEAGELERVRRGHQPRDGD